MAGPSPGMPHQRGHPSGGKAAEPEQHGMKLRSTPHPGTVFATRSRRHFQPIPEDSQLTPEGGNAPGSPLLRRPTLSRVTFLALHKGILLALPFAVGTRRRSGQVGGRRAGNRPSIRKPDYLRNH